MIREDVRDRADELASRTWNTVAIEQRYRRVVGRSCPRALRTCSPEERCALLDTVRRATEEFNFYTHHCARGALLGLMEAFQVGSLELVKSLSPFPGYAGTGTHCGAATAGLMAIALALGSDDVHDEQAVSRTMAAGQRFLTRFEQAFGTVHCSKIHEDLFGRDMNPAASEENMRAFATAKGFERCSAVAGVGAQLAAETILDMLTDRKR